MSKYLAIVESPTKAKTIGKFLGKDFTVLASYGHVRDLPTSAAEIPAEVKKEKWARLGVNVDKDFEALYVVPAEKKERIRELKANLKDAEELLLATDEDREGESISWHLLEVLKPKIPVKRLVFHEITKEAIDHALETARSVDENLVRAQETRRIVDRLYGYSVSPVLWKKMAPRLSAGRVQSVAMRLLVERERERIKFRTACYWDLKASLKALNDPQLFDAELTHVASKRVASGKDFDPDTGKLKNPEEVVLLSEVDAQKLRDKLQSVTPIVGEVEEKPFVQKPSAPFTTSTLQQDANRRLGYSVKRTMALAQQLYENGFITYMRTDSTTLSAEAIEGAKKCIRSEFGPEFLSAETRAYATKVKNAQEAHEAIRPAGTEFTPPDVVRNRLGPDAARLYELIWKRTLASQMKDAHGTRIGVRIDIADAQFRASGKTIAFAGFLRAYVEGSDDPEQQLADQDKVLPKMAKGDNLSLQKIEDLKHETQPPARYTEGSLIKELERRGIGRPSTWATIVDVVLSRTYAFKKGSALVPSFVAMAVSALLEQYFPKLVDYEFTARLEEDLDNIANGEVDNLKYLKGFYHGEKGDGLHGLVSSGEEKIDPRIVCGYPIGTSPEGKNVEVRIGKFGPFLSDGERKASFPDSLCPDELTIERAIQILTEAAKGPQSLGVDPASGNQVYLKAGRFGPYLQLGEIKEGEDRPKMASLLPGMSPDAVDFETALKLLALPKNLGKHPTIGEDITVANGKFGPYVKCGAETRSVPTAEFSLLDLTQEQAIELLSRPRTRRGQTVTKAAPLRELGKHPLTELPLIIKSGKFGPYVTDGTINASLPRGVDIQSLSMEEAVNLLEARAAKIAAEGDNPVKKGRRGGRAKATKAKAAPKAKATKASSKSKSKKSE
jgi:DNA topoisomerase-1